MPFKFSLRQNCHSPLDIPAQANMRRAGSAFPFTGQGLCASAHRAVQRQRATLDWHPVDSAVCKWGRIQMTVFSMNLAARAAALGCALTAAMPAAAFILPELPAGVTSTIEFRGYGKVTEQRLECIFGGCDPILTPDFFQLPAVDTPVNYSMIFEVTKPNDPEEIMGSGISKLKIWSEERTLAYFSAPSTYYSQEIVEGSDSFDSTGSRFYWYLYPTYGNGGFTYKFCFGCEFNDNDDWYYGFDAALNVREVITNGVSVTVPEPASWGMFIAGFGMAGFMLRRRRSAQQPLHQMQKQAL
ncbi:PEPxxWA-CTERM sorting domain-containing protein [Sandaracinobacteroides sp. A072]|uniref:PEPxxWA-CTERM sorting domain-containing protein n=1 Tax=Sandaracinobacteroides sp. A072 TaxID=3461146 RepID=UPI0040414BDC